MLTSFQESGEILEALRRNRSQWYEPVKRFGTVTSGTVRKYTTLTQQGGAELRQQTGLREP